ncbi:MAG: hypothetical protein WB565_13260 [Acidimicrobiales bacterium]
MLIFALRLAVTLPGSPAISSQIEVDPAQGASGIGWNVYTVSKWGITLCVFKDEYRLERNGTSVAVTTNVRYGPLPGILTDRITYSASIFDEGFRSEYKGMHLLGATWDAAYKVSSDEDHVAGLLTCEWGEAVEHLFRRKLG